MRSMAEAEQKLLTATPCMLCWQRILGTGLTPARPMEHRRGYPGALPPPGSNMHPSLCGGSHGRLLQLHLLLPSQVWL
jgi:hypothetical protein